MSHGPRIRPFSSSEGPRRRYTYEVGHRLVIVEPIGEGFDETWGFHVWEGGAVVAGSRFHFSAEQACARALEWLGGNVEQPR